MQSLRSILSGSRPSAGSSVHGAPAGSSSKPATLLVIQVDNYDWPEIFRGATLSDGRELRVYQAGWDKIQVTYDSYSSSCLQVIITELAKCATHQTQTRGTLNIQPDFVLIRNEVRMPHFDGRGRLDGFLFADVPSVNSLQSILLQCERPAMQGQLRRLNRLMGDEFPVPPQHFCSSSRSLMYGYTFPAIVKVGSAHAGAGKMKVEDHHQMADFRSILTMMPDEHCMVEPFIVGEMDLRIQKIGQNYRAFSRVGISGAWKTNTGSSVMEEVEISERWKKWVDAASEMFGGLEILAVDAIVEEGTGKEYILEVNGTSIGLHPDCAHEDNWHIRELVLERMSELA